MSLCKLMIADFEGHRSDLEISFGKDVALYSRGDLITGIEYSQWMLELGMKTDWLLDYDLASFIRWAKNKLETIKD